MNPESRLQIERYLQVVNRRKLVLVVPVVLAFGAAVLLSLLTPKEYRASATARVDLSAANVDIQNQSSATRYLNTYSRIIQTTPFMERVIQDLNLKTTPARLAQRVSTSTIAETELVTVSATASNGKEAAAIANDLTNLLHDPAFFGQFVTSPSPTLVTQIDTARQTFDTEQAKLASLQQSGGSSSDISSQQTVVDAAHSSYQNLLTELDQATTKQRRAAEAFTVIDAAQAPGKPSSPNWALNLSAGLLTGLAVGVGVSFLLEYVDPTLRGVRDLEEVTRLPILASIPFGVRWKYPPSVSADYRLLATKLQWTLRDPRRRSLLFTSARAEEGNTTVATYTALAMAQAGLRVLLVDANLNRPDIHKLFNMQLAPGLYNFISTNGARPTKPIPQAAPEMIQASALRRLGVLTAGNRMSDPSELLASQEMRQFLDYLETEWDVVVIDGPSMSTSAGSAVIATVVDGVVVVAAEGQASSRSVEETIKELNSLGAHPLGLVYCKATEA